MKSDIVIKNVSFAYEKEEPVLSDISLSFHSGTTAIIGQNGAGKTTLMKLLNGLLKPDCGDVWIDSQNTRQSDTSLIAKQVGLIFQNPDDQIFKSRVLDEVVFGPRNIGMSEQDAKTSAMMALQQVRLEAYADENPYDLGYAERKLVCIASILAMNTDVVIFDEPTIAQDVAGIERIGQIVLDLKAKGRTVIAIVHDMNFAARYFDRIVSMAEGRILADGAPGDVFCKEELLCHAHVDKPTLAKLSAMVELGQPYFQVEDFVNAYKTDILGEAKEKAQNDKSHEDSF